MTISEGFFKKLFLVAALYDFVLGVAFLFLYKQIFTYFSIDLPSEPMYLQLAAAFVFAMGVGYYFIFKNMYRNVDLVKLGIVYKFVYSSFSSYFYFIGSAHVIFFLFAVLDLTFAGLFIWFLKFAQKKVIIQN